MTNNNDGFWVYIPEDEEYKFVSYSEYHKFVLTCQVDYGITSNFLINYLTALHFAGFEIDSSLYNVPFWQYGRDKEQC